MGWLSDQAFPFLYYYKQSQGFWLFTLLESSNGLVVHGYDYSTSVGQIILGIEFLPVGRLYLLANPLLMLGLYVFAFGVVFGGRFTDSPDESTIDYALGVFLGLNVLGLISGIIVGAPGIIVSQPNS